MTPRSGIALGAPNLGLEDALRTFPTVLDNLSRIYGELEERAEHVEEKLVQANVKLECKVAELDALRRHLEAVLESLPCGVVVRDANRRIVRVNDSAQRILDVSAGELLGRSSHQALPPLADDGEPRELIRRDGERLVLASHYATIRSGDGTVDGTVEILDDRTERTALEERLHANDKMAAMGTLAAGVAHEIRNPMNAVKGFAALIHARTDGECADIEQIHRWAGHIVAGTGEMDSIIENMLTFGSPERLRIERIDGSELIQGALDNAFEDCTEGTRIETGFQSTAPSFHGDRIKLRQALRNLIANAANAQPDGGSIQIALDLQEDEIVFHVDDAGPGVPAGLRSRVLDPFFTTHPDGTGLGLALVSTIARLHGGSVEVCPDPSPLGGARFLLRIPYLPDEVPE